MAESVILEHKYFIYLRHALARQSSRSDRKEGTAGAKKREQKHFGTVFFNVFGAGSFRREKNRPRIR
jgi:hypothetical protein